MAETVKLAAVQMDVAIGDVGANLHAIARHLHAACFNGANLVVFPECALTGYGFSGVEEAIGPACEAATAADSIKELCRQLDVTTVVGTLTTDGAIVQNAALITTPDAQSVYHKCHLPYLGVDKVTTPGGSLDVVDTPAGRVGTIICYDVRFPEAARALGLKNADVICVPTNWPEGAESSPEFVCRTRAYENRVYLVAANRVGTERGFTFIGRSQICDPAGNKLAEADGMSETILYADADLEFARNKKVIIRKDDFEMDLFGDRRPEVYAAR